MQVELVHLIIDEDVALVVQEEVMESDFSLEFLRVDMSESIHLEDMLIVEPKYGQEDADFRREVDLHRSVQL